MTTLLARFAREESGATAMEYGLIAAVIGIAIIAGAGLLGSELGNLFTRLSDLMKNEAPAAPAG